MAEEFNPKRTFNPAVLQTKQELLVALHNGELHASKYQLLSENEKMFVELVIFAGYTGEQAIKQIDPTIRFPLAVANRMMASKDIQDVFEELTAARDKKFKSEAVNARDLALRALTYMMQTSASEETKLVAAKTILEKTNDYLLKSKENNEQQVTRVQYNIKVDNVNVGGAKNGVPQHEPIILESEEEKIARAEAARLAARSTPIDEELKEAVPQYDGMPYTLVYEGVNSYGEEDKQNDDRGCAEGGAGEMD